MFDNIIRTIWAILTLSFVGLIIYFRKPLKSILHTLSDVDSLKAGPLEFKRRQQINKEMNEFLSEAEKMISDFTNTSEEYILWLNKALFATSASLASTLSNSMEVVDSSNLKNIISIRNKCYHYIKSKEPDSSIVTFVETMKLCESMSSTLPPLEESQQSNP